ncbi:MAG: DUF222 domain-containing protein [Egibacteraceae bacterium]
MFESWDGASRSARSACDALAARDLSTLGDAQLAADVAALTQVAARVAAERLRCVAAVAGRVPDPAVGAEQARRLLRAAGRASGGQAVREARLAVSLAGPGLEATAAALAAGRISPGQAEALVRAVRSHPELVAGAQDELVDLASRSDDRAFRELLADRCHAADPGPEEERACRQYAARRFGLSLLPDGMTRADGLLDPVGAALLGAALDALAGPDPATVPDELRRTREQRNADALVELARKALARTDELPCVAGLQPRATVFLTPEMLGEEPDASAARLDWAGTVCGAAARRVACDADVVRRRVTRDGRTVWVDVRRHPSPAQRLAVVERDRVCRFVYPGGIRCERSWQWCDVHHVEHHGDGGPTLIPNLCLLCAQHHHAVHGGGWTVTGNADATLAFHPPLGWPHHQHTSLRPRRTRPDRPAPRTAPPGRPDADANRHHNSCGDRDPDPPQLVLIE